MRAVLTSSSARHKQKTAAVTIMSWTDLSPENWQTDGKHTFSLCRPKRRKFLEIKIAGSRIRTDDLLITNQLL
jgi:hypothetical protein